MSRIAETYRGSKEYSLVYAELITAARYRGTLRYQELARLIGLPTAGNYMGSVLGRLLGAISEDEVARGRPMLSVLAAGSEAGPGKGFFELAAKLGRFDGGDRQAFLKAETKAVYDTWKVMLPRKRD